MVEQPKPVTTNTGAQPSALLRWLPGLASLRDYRREWLPGDILAGTSVCIVMIPAVIAYAGLMGLPPQNGLYAALIPLLVYPFFGSSRQMIVGPDIAISLLIASTITPLAAGNPGRAAALAAMLTGLSGLLLVLGARAGLGAVADFLSKPVLVGYMTGAALILICSQLGYLFGVPLKGSDFFPRLIELATELPQAHGRTIATGLGVLLLLVVLRRISPKIPGALLACAAAIVVSQVLRLEEQGVAVVGLFPRGLPVFALPEVSWRDLDTLLPGAVGIALLTYTEGILLARAFAAKNNYEVSAERELTALGLADVAAGLFQGFSITGSQARTTLNDATGAKSQLSSLVAAVMLALFLLFLTPLMAHLPKVALAAILIYAGFGLLEFKAMAQIYRSYPQSSVVAGLTTLSVLAAGVVPGILFGVVLSLLGLINRVSHPPDAVLSQVPGNGFHDLGNAAERQTVPGLIVYRFYAPLLFSNVGHFVERVRNLVSQPGPPVRWFVLDAQAISDIDDTAVDAVRRLSQELRQRGIALTVAHANPPLRALLQRTGLAADIGPASFFHSVHECIAAFQASVPQPVEGASGTDRQRHLEH